MILEFTSPDDDDRFRAAWHGLDLVEVIRVMDNYLRDRLKYGTITESERAYDERFRAKLREISDECGVAWIFE